MKRFVVYHRPFQCDRDPSDPPPVAAGWEGVVLSDGTVMAQALAPTGPHSVWRNWDDFARWHVLKPDKVDWLDGEP